MALTDIDGQRLGDSVADKLGDRNLIINGSMQVAQRATQVTGVTTTGYHTCDRIQQFIDNLGTWTSDQSTDAPEGFSNSYKVTCTTANASPIAGALLFASHAIEAQNLQHLNYGTANAVSLTLSFWVKSNKTGAATLEMYQPDPATDRHITKSYSINAADTWEYKTITFSGDTAGQIDNDNGVGLFVNFWLNSGSNFTGGSLQTTWATVTGTNRNSSNLGVGGAVNDYWQITGLQLEVGNTATPFQHRSYADELHRCRRYYFDLFYGANTTAVGLPIRADNNNNRELMFINSPAIRVEDADLTVTLSTGTLSALSIADPYFTRILVDAGNDTTLIFAEAVTVNAEL